MNTTIRRAPVGVAALTAFATATAVACSSNTSPPATINPAPVSVGSAATATLTVMNFLDWCSVSINGGAASVAASMETPVAVGSTATIVARPASAAFTIGPDPWFGVTQDDGGPASGTDMGAGTSETSTATVVVTGNHCVSVCCQQPGNAPVPCPTTNPCRAVAAGATSSSGSGATSSSGSSGGHPSGSSGGSSSGSSGGHGSGSSGVYNPPGY